MEISVQLSEEMLKEKQALIEALKKDETVLKFLFEHDLPISFVEQFPYRIQKGINNVKRCEKCMGLSHCTQPNHGEVNALIYDGMLRLQPKLCDYAKASKSERNHLKKYWINQMPDHLHTVSLKQIDKKNESADYLRALSEVSMNVMEPDHGLFLYGAVGTGKTYLASCIANYYARKGHSVVFVQTPSWISKVKTMLNDPDGFDREMEMMKHAEVVVFDDFGAESVTPWVRDELLFTILNERMENERLTYFTSNEDFDSLKKHFALSSAGEEEMKAVRLMERVKKLSKALEIRGKNRRFAQ